MGAAAHRAIHQLLEEGRVFKDPLAVSLLGWPSDELLKRANERPEDRGLRFFIAARSELAEAKLAEAVANRGVAQAVILGAGLDTFAYRNPFGGHLRVFEIDHPATQKWKRERLASAGIATTQTVSFVPADLEKTGLLDALAEGRFDFAGRAFFIWLGTVPYLTGRAIEETLTAIGGLPAGAELAFDYAEPLSDDASPAAERFRDLRNRVAAAGEPFVSFFHPADLQAALGAAGFEHIEDHTVRALAERHLGAEAVAARARAGTPFPDRGGHVVFASTN
jgi:methyltransferase (TIGR00027 family)